MSRVPAAQVALRWIADTGCSYTTACSTKLGGASARFRENLDVFDFKLTPSEVATLAEL